jgi:hypothetical protein
MSKYMNIDELMREFAALEGSVVGRGPRHPDAPEPRIQVELDELLRKHPFLKSDKGYIEFLERYAGAAIDREDESLIAHIFGFSNVTLNLLEDDQFSGSAVDEDGFFMFCSSVVSINTEKDIVSILGLDYAFEVTGSRNWGIYQSISQSDGKSSGYRWYCQDFIQWLAEFIKFDGKLFP